MAVHFRHFNEGGRAGVVGGLSWVRNIRALPSRQFYNGHVVDGMPDIISELTKIVGAHLYAILLIRFVADLRIARGIPRFSGNEVPLTWWMAASAMDLSFSIIGS